MLTTMIKDSERGRAEGEKERVDEEGEEKLAPLANFFRRIEAPFPAPLSLSPFSWVGACILHGRGGV